MVPKATITRSNREVEKILPADSTPAKKLRLDKHSISNQSNEEVQVGSVSCVDVTNEEDLGKKEVREDPTDQLKKMVTRLNSKIWRLNEKLEAQNKEKQDQQERIDNLREELVQLKKDKHFQALKVIQEDANEEKSSQACFLLNVIENYPKKSPRWSKETIRQCVLWRYASPKGYRFARSLIKLPCNTTLKTYTGGMDGQSGITELIKGRLSLEAKKLNNHEKFVSIAIDEMSLNGQLIYDRKLDRLFGKKDTTQFIKENEAQFNPEAAEEWQHSKQDPVVANQLLCFLVNGISTPLSIPGAFFFSKQLTGKELYELTLSVICEVEKCGFLVVRLVTDNHKSNVAMFRRFGGGKRMLQEEVPHPCDSSRSLFLSFDPSHIIKNVRTQMLEAKVIEEDDVSGQYIKDLYHLQKDMSIKPVKKLTRKHVYPTNFEKMNVARAIDLFSTEVIAALKYLKDNRFSHPQARKFKNCSQTIEYLSVMKKWFDIHNVRNRSHYLQSQNENKMQFFSVTDERLEWLETTFNDYVCDMKDKQPSLITYETLQAIVLTSHSTSACIKYLLGIGFHFILTSKLTSDCIEMFFSNMRQTSGGNDMLDARAATFAIENILRCGSKTLKKSVGANVHPDSLTPIMGMLEKNLTDDDIFREIPNDISKVIPDNVTATLDELNRLPENRPPSIKQASLAYLGGVILRFCEKDGSYEECCFEKISAPGSDSPLLGLIRKADQGNLRYPSKAFVAVLETIQNFVECALPFLPTSGLLTKLESLIIPKLENCPVLICGNQEHTRKMAKTVVVRLVPPLLDNLTKNISEKYEKVKQLTYKPVSRKVLKV